MARSPRIRRFLEPLSRPSRRLDILWGQSLSSSSILVKWLALAFTRPVSSWIRHCLSSSRGVADMYFLAATILKGTGSVGLALIFWAIGLVTSATSLSVYLEYASYFPNRSGSEVVYLEQAFPRPRYFFPVAFAVQTVILSFSSGNAIGGLCPI